MVEHKGRDEGDVGDDDDGEKNLLLLLLPANQHWGKQYVRKSMRARDREGRAKIVSNIKKEQTKINKNKVTCRRQR